MKVADLEGDALDYWVMKAEYPDTTISFAEWPRKAILYSRSWNWGGPIIERARIAFYQTWHEGHTHFSVETRWTACTNGTSYSTEIEGDSEARGPTQLVAAMRAYVASKFGDEVAAAQT